LNPAAVLCSHLFLLALDKLESELAAVFWRNSIFGINELASLFNDKVASLVALCAFRGTQNLGQDLAWIAEQMVWEVVLCLPRSLRLGRVARQAIYWR